MAAGKRGGRGYVDRGLALESELRRLQDDCVAVGDRIAAWLPPTSLPELAQADAWLHNQDGRRALEEARKAIGAALTHLGFATALGDPAVARRHAAAAEGAHAKLR